MAAQVQAVKALASDRHHHLQSRVSYCSQALCLSFLVQVMKVVKDLVSGDITICSTIHSPTPFTFRLFDRMLILLRGQVQSGTSRSQKDRSAEHLQHRHSTAPRWGRSDVRPPFGQGRSIP